jgi:hypothetical protein
MLGSISQLLDFDEQADVTDTNKIQPMSLFRLLVALEQTSVDAMRDDYSILELVKDDSSSSKTTSVITPTTLPTTNMAVVSALGQGSMIAPVTIKTLDFCYADDDTIFTVLNCIDVCVTVGKLHIKTFTRREELKVWVRLIGESSTDTQLVSTHIYLQPRTLVLAPNHTHTRCPPAISIDIFTFGVIQVNRFSSKLKKISIQFLTFKLFS